MTNKLIVIPARYGSKRFPGKPLAKIAGKEMLLRVYENALLSSKSFNGVSVVVATEDERIVEFCKTHNMECVLTSPDCESSAKRVLEAVKKVDVKPDFVINLHGDYPLCPPWVISDILQSYELDKEIEVATACVQLDWKELDDLRKKKQENPYTGTTCVMDNNMDACWFSKAIIPSMKDEAELRKIADVSPIYRHVGIYGYKPASLEEGAYEKIEGLEQLRFIENNIKVRMVIVDYKEYGNVKGIDSEDDLSKAEEFLKNHGEFL